MDFLLILKVLLEIGPAATFGASLGGFTYLMVVALAPDYVVRLKMLQVGFLRVMLLGAMFGSGVYGLFIGN